jgi:Predicted membrane protein
MQLEDQELKTESFINHQTSLRGIAIFEAFKGLIVLFAGLGLLNYLHTDLQVVLDHFLTMLGMSHGPQDHLYIRDLLRGLTETNLIWIAIAAMAYAAIRLVEAYGLWHSYTWAKWLGIVSGAIYLPYEFYKLVESFSFEKVGIIVINLLIVLYLIYVRKDEKTV